MPSIDYTILFSFLISFLVSYISIPKIISFANRYRLSDVPGRRASHKISIPIFGGIAIFLGVVISLLLFSDFIHLRYIIIALLIVCFIGMIDDLLGLTPYKKLIGQVISILIVVYLADMQIDSMYGVLGFHTMPNYMALIFTVFVFIVITNGFNLIDGVDGLAGGLGIIASLCFGTVAIFMNQADMAILAFSLFGSLLAFLRFNLHPARIFMGDTGSLVVGMTLSVLAINLIKSGIVTETIHFPNKGPLLAIAFLGVPLFDSFRVFIARVRSGRHPLYPGRGHIHHALLRLGVGHQITSILLYIFAISLILSSFYMLQLNINTSIMILSAISLSILLLPFFIIRYRNLK